MLKKFQILKFVFLFDGILAIILIGKMTYKNTKVIGISYADNLPSNDTISQLDATSNLYLEYDTDKVFDSEYEYQIYNKDSDASYKLIDLTIGKTKAHLVVIYDPSKILMMVCKEFKTANNTGKESVLDMNKRYGTYIGVNGGGFVDNGLASYDVPVGYLIKDGTVIWGSQTRKGKLIGFTNDNKLLLVEATAKEAINMGMKDAMEFGPFLIVNGSLETLTDKSKAARTVIDQREDGIVLFLVTEGTSNVGITLEDATAIMRKYGAINAANLDGGSSSSLVINNKLINSPYTMHGIQLTTGRKVVSAWGVKA